MPLEPSDFPEEVQVAFFMLSYLSDSWEGMSGTYMGKVWNDIEYLFKLHQVDNPKQILYFMKLYERLIVDYKMEQADNKRKAEERKAQAASGKQYTHNVKG